VEFDKKYKTDQIYIEGKEVSGAKKDRVVQILNLVRKNAGLNFPRTCFRRTISPRMPGLLLPPRDFSALALAASRAAGLNLSQKELSILARIGSGSACRSILTALPIGKGEKIADRHIPFKLHLPIFGT